MVKIVDNGRQIEVWIGPNHDMPEQVTVRHRTGMEHVDEMVFVRESKWREAAKVAEAAINWATQDENDKTRNALIDAAVDWERSRPPSSVDATEPSDG